MKISAKIIQLLFFSAVLIIVSCSRNPYVTTNRSYKKQAKKYAKMLAKYPVEDSVVNAPYWIGTTNFNMRKPNFVILHHTAQNSCEQT